MPPAVTIGKFKPVALKPVVQLDLWMSARIFEKFEMTLMLFSLA
jgi:hypothetical protein